MEKFSHIAFYGLDYKDELYFVTKSNQKKFQKKFGYDLLEDYRHEDEDVYLWVKKNCRFVGYVACVL